MNWFTHLFGRLHFHRRIFYGLVMLIGLAYWLYDGKDQYSKWVARRNELAKPKLVANQAERKLPDLSPQIIPTIKRVEPVALDPAFSGSGRNDSSTDQRTSKSSSLTVRDDRTSGKKLGENLDSDLDEVANLLTKALDLSSKPFNESKSLAFLQAREIKNIYKKLLEMEVPESQRDFVIFGFLDSLSLMDSLNVQAGLRMNEVREELLERVPVFLNDTDDQLASQAALVLTISSAVDFLSLSSRTNFDQFSKNVNQHFDRIVSDPANGRKLAAMLLLVRDAAAFERETSDLCRETLVRFDSQTDPEVVKTATYFKNGYYFGQLDLESLPGQIARFSSEVDVDVSTLFTGLQEYPEADFEVYQTAMDVIRELIRTGKNERASELIQLFGKQIAPQIQPPSKQKKVLKALSELKRFL